MSPSRRLVVGTFSLALAVGGLTVARVDGLRAAPPSLTRDQEMEALKRKADAVRDKLSSHDQAVLKTAIAEWAAVAKDFRSCTRAT
jgi:hypothetical protein